MAGPFRSFDLSFEIISQQIQAHTHTFACATHLNCSFWLRRSRAEGPQASEGGAQARRAGVLGGRTLFLFGLQALRAWGIHPASPDGEVEGAYSAPSPRWRFLFLGFTPAFGRWGYTGSGASHPHLWFFASERSERAQGCRRQPRRARRARRG